MPGLEAKQDTWEHFFKTHSPNSCIEVSPHHYLDGGYHTIISVYSGTFKPTPTSTLISEPNRSIIIKTHESFRELMALLGSGCCGPNLSVRFEDMTISYEDCSVISSLLVEKNYPEKFRLSFTRTQVDPVGLENIARTLLMHGIKSGLRIWGISDPDIESHITPRDLLVKWAMITLIIQIESDRLKQKQISIQVSRPYELDAALTILDRGLYPSVVFKLVTKRNAFTMDDAMMFQTAFYSPHYNKALVCHLEYISDPAFICNYLASGARYDNLHLQLKEGNLFRYIQPNPLVNNLSKREGGMGFLIHMLPPPYCSSETREQLIPALTANHVRGKKRFYETLTGLNALPSNFPTVIVKLIAQYAISNFPYSTTDGLALIRMRELPSFKSNNARYGLGETALVAVEDDLYTVDNTDRSVTQITGGQDKSNALMHLKVACELPVESNNTTHFKVATAEQLDLIQAVTNQTFTATNSPIPAEIEPHLKIRDQKIDVIEKLQKYINERREEQRNSGRQYQFSSYLWGCIIIEWAKFFKPACSADNKIAVAQDCIKALSANKKVTFFGTHKKASEDGRLNDLLQPVRTNLIG